MEVTKSNFNDFLPEIRKAIDECTFMGIDCEMTGLKVATNNINTFDTPNQYYDKVRRDCREFLVIQCGLSLFRYAKDRDVFKHQTYNFYIFRRPVNKFIRDQRFLCQASSIDFLISQGFDFNKLFKEGVSYLNISEQAKCRENMEEMYKKRMGQRNSQQSSNNDRVVIPEDAQDFVLNVTKQLEKFVDSDETEIALPKCNSFLRRLIYQTKEEKFADKISLETRHVDKDRVLYATRFKSKEELQEIEKKKHNELVAQLEDYSGFTKVMKMIVESEKMVVGHNIMLDFLHIIDKFLTPLPDDYDEFKECAHTLFKNILDTKYMSSISPFRELIASNVLKYLLDSVTTEPFEVPKLELEEGKLSYDLKYPKEHEAGYDAFMTSVCFLSMWKHLGTNKKLSNRDTFRDLNLLRPYTNKIFLMVLSDNQYINLGGSDMNPSRDHVFYMTFPKEWKSNNLVQLFSPFGNIQIAWLDETSAYIGLYKRDQAAVALSTLSQSEVYTIMTFAKRRALLTGGKTMMPSPIMKRTKSLEMMQAASKRRRTESFGRSDNSKRSIDRIDEEEDTGEDISDTPVKKVFTESEWD